MGSTGAVPADVPGGALGPLAHRTAGPLAHRTAGPTGCPPGPRAAGQETSTSEP